MAENCRQPRAKQLAECRTVQRILAVRPSRSSFADTSGGHLNLRQSRGWQPAKRSLQLYAGNRGLTRAAGTLERGRADCESAG